MDLQEAENKAIKNSEANRTYVFFMVKPFYTIKGFRVIVILYQYFLCGDPDFYPIPLVG
jgi:hypothetical protein